ncbi:hypothetical protein CsatB_025101 [Cannabis sativa]
MDELYKCEANYVPLSPITFLKRAATSYANRTSLIYDNTRFTWLQTYQRCRRLASSLRSLNIVKNNVVSVLAPNIPAMYEMHFAVAMAGGVLNTINTRLDTKNIAAILKHSESKMFFVDYQFVQTGHEALQILAGESRDDKAKMPLVVVIDDIDVPNETRLGELEYEELIRRGDPKFESIELDDEWDAIALNYTSGTTSSPKGVVYSHRGAYLSTLSLLLGWEMRTHPIYLWTLPMFHCNGWTFTWGVAARGGTNVCLRHTTADKIYQNISLHKVTHMCCAPIIFNILLEAAIPENHRKMPYPVEILTGGAPPPATLLEKMESLGFHVTHAYGLTEATGPALVCEWQAQWNKLSKEKQAQIKARQGIRILSLADVDVKNLRTMESMPRDGKSLGEIVIRGSSLMKGYFKDPKTTSLAFKNGWFLTGDVGVVHSDGYIEIKDRSKDVIISGGENISSIEIESVLYTHPMISEAAVVAMPHPRWGESPCAFVAGAGAGDLTEAEILRYCRNNMAHYMVPKKVVFVKELPKTSTGKIQKFELRAMAKSFTVTEKEKETSSNYDVALSRL